MLYQNFLNKSAGIILKKTFLLLIIFLLIAAAQLSGEEYENYINDYDALYVITGFNFDITGRTREFALIRRIGFREGETFLGRAALEQYISDKTQELYNQRILTNNPEINAFIGEQQEDGSFPVILYVKVEDSRNIIALPRPRFRSNDAFNMLIQARDFNFFGTMSTLRLDLGYNLDLSPEDRGQHSFHIRLDANVPLRMFDFDWDFRFSNLFEYRPSADERFFFRNITGLSMELPFRSTTFTFGIEEHFNLNEENPRSHWGENNEFRFQSGLYMTTRLFTNWEIPTGLLKELGELTYTPGISVRFNHELRNPQWALHDFRIGPFLNFNHSLGFSRIDWRENYRTGFSLDLTNGFTLDVHRLNNNNYPLSADLTLRGIGHFIISDFFGISTRLMYQHWFYRDPAYNDQAASTLRGIADREISANYMLSLNLDFPFRVLLFKPSEWFNNRRLRFFDFEMHASPVFDFALYNGFIRNPNNLINVKNIDFAASGGLEVIVFPAFMRNFIVRLGYTFNMREFVDSRRIPTGENREIYFIMGHFF